MTSAAPQRPLEALIAVFPTPEARDGFATVAGQMEGVIVGVTVKNYEDRFDALLDLAGHLRTGDGSTAPMAQAVASIATAHGATGVVRHGPAIESDEIY